MTPDIALFLAQDGIVNAAIYALIALALVLVFLVTRILFVPQGEFISYSALTLAALGLGQVPATIWVLLVGAIASAVMSTLREHARIGRLRLAPDQAGLVAYAVIVFVLVEWLAPTRPPQWIAIPLTLAIIVPMGPILYTTMSRASPAARTSRCSSPRWRCTMPWWASGCCCSEPRERGPSRCRISPSAWGPCWCPRRACW